MVSYLKLLKLSQKAGNTAILKVYDYILPLLL